MRLTAVAPPSRDGAKPVLELSVDGVIVLTVGVDGVEGQVFHFTVTDYTARELTVLWALDDAMRKQSVIPMDNPGD